jgi:aminopeptidase-like protein
MNILNLDKIFDRLFPINRSITGAGYIKSINILREYVPFKLLKYPSGNKIFDWITPKEWSIKEAYISLNKKKIIDFKKNNLHILNYSQPINKILSLKDLNRNLYSLKKKPNLIPYVTSYYDKNWGFCIQHNKRKKLKEGKYHVVIKSSFKNGNIINGLAKIKGRGKKIVLLTSYLCHPSMANNELSGPLVLIELYNRIKKWDNRNFNYYFLINPETIGSVCFIHQYKNILKKNLHSGMVLTCLGGKKKKLTYTSSKLGGSSLDKIFSYFEVKNKINKTTYDPTRGSDQRQYCSGELNLPMGVISREVPGNFYEYHTSGDDKKFMSIKQIEKSADELESILKINDLNFIIKRKIPYCELQLGRRNLYPNINFNNSRKSNPRDILNLLAYADGEKDLIDICKISKKEINSMIKALNICIKNKLVKDI